MEAIPKFTAWQLCEEIRLENQARRFTPGALQCRFCFAFSKKSPAGRCVSNVDGYRGCYQVNRRYDLEFIHTGTVNDQDPRRRLGQSPVRG